jgi:hypothetical protein
MFFFIICLSCPFLFVLHKFHKMRNSFVEALASSPDKLAFLYLGSNVWKRS